MTKQAVQRSRDSSLSVRLFHWAVFGFLVLALLLGGASRAEVITPDIVALAALPVLGMAIWRLRSSLAPEWRLPLLLLGGIALLPLLQLIPLPPSVWTALPGREPVVAGLKLAGAPIGWAPLSLSPQATWTSFLSLLAPAAMLLAALTISAEWRGRMILFVIAFGVVSVLLGAAQLAGGEGSALRFYAVTNTSTAVGFFSNRNHFAALLVCVVVFASAWASESALGKAPSSRRNLLFALAAVALAVAGIGLTGSRAGLVLLIPAGLGALALAWRSGVSRGRGWRGLAVLGAGFVVAAVLVQLTFGAAIDRLQAGFSEDIRIVAASGTWTAIKAFMPFGSGFGSFVPVYKMFEGPEAVINTYINHAHDDWLEVLLEGGVLAALLLLAFLVWFARQAARVWSLGGVEAAPARAASLCILLLLVHSLADYPLRSPAMSVLFALCCAMMLAYPSARARRDGGRLV